MADQDIRLRRPAGAPPLLMGIVNVTPDSFSDGGRFSTIDTAITHGNRLVDDGASIIDIGGESTRPGHRPIEANVEKARVLPVIKALNGLPVPISIDTMKAEVASAALQAGARIVNDVWGLQRDRNMADIIAEHKAGIIITHNRDETDGAIDILAEVKAFLSRSIEIALSAGIAPARIALDPGLGFGKTHEQNLHLISAIGRLQALGFPLLIGLSRKSFIGRIIDRPVTERGYGTLAANLLAARRGADILRVHDVAHTRDGLAVEAAIGDFRDT